MKSIRWTKEESILVLELYKAKPCGMKAAAAPGVRELAALLGRTPQGVRRRMARFRDWYPSLPFVFDTPVVREEAEVEWGAYFADPKRLAREAKQIRQGLQVRILVFELYFRLVIDTMDERVPEVIELAARLGCPVREVVALLREYVACDPFVKRKPEGVPASPSPLSRLVWRNFFDEPDRLKDISLSLNASYAKRQRNPKKSVRPA